MNDDAIRSSWANQSLEVAECERMRRFSLVTLQIVMASVTVVRACVYSCLMHSVASALLHPLLVCCCNLCSWNLYCSQLRSDGLAHVGSNQNGISQGLRTECFCPRFLPPFLARTLLSPHAEQILFGRG
jgi:hypothetical protein